MTASRARACAAAVVLAVSAAGCGGGGAGAAAPPAPAPVTPASALPLALSASNTLAAGTLAFGLGSVALGLGQQVVDWLDQIAAKAPPGPECRGLGTQSVTWVDKDASGGLSPGDQVNVGLKGCWLVPLEDVFDGTLVVDLLPAASGARWVARVTLGSDLNQPSSDGNVRLGGQLQLEAYQDRLAKRLRMSSAAEPWTIRFEPRVASPGVLNGLETVRQLAASREIRRDTGRNTVRVDLQLDSEALQGRLSLQTTTPFESWIGARPEQGQFVLGGAPGPSALVSLDAAGLAIANFGGATAGTASHSELSLDFLWSGAGWLPLAPTDRQYALQTAAAVGLRVWSAPPPGPIAPNAVLEWWYSRPMQKAPDARDIFELTGGYRWGDGTVAAEVQTEGGVVTIRPRAQLTPGSEYRLWTSLNSASVRQGDAVVLPNLGDARWTAARAVTVVAVLDAPMAVFGHAALPLDASGSRALDAAGVVRYRWSQLSGPALSFANPDAARTSVTSDAGTTAVATVRLEAFDAQGVVDRVDVSVPVVGVPAEAALVKTQAGGATPMVFVSPAVPGQPSGGIDLRYLPAINALQVSTLRTPLNTLLTPSITLSTAASWRAGAVIPFNTQSADYPRAYFQADDDCDPRSGTIRILEVQQAANGDFLRLAVDVDLQCLVTGRQHQAALRWRSTVPLSW